MISVKRELPALSGLVVLCLQLAPVGAASDDAVPDGGDIIALSHHETNEWDPSVDHHGMIVYSRRDYVDRSDCIAHHIWVCYPDGRDSRSYHGNYPLRPEHRPQMEMGVRAVPGSPRYVAVAAPHHRQCFGSLILIDQQLHEAPRRVRRPRRRPTCRGSL